MLYKKNILGKTPKYRRAVVRFDGGLVTNIDDKSLSTAVGKLCYNCDGKSGALVDIGGISTFDINYVSDGQPCVYSVSATQSILKAWHYKRTNYQTNACDDRIILLLADMKLYQVFFNAPCAPTPVGDIVFNEIPQAVNYKLEDTDVIMFSSPSDSLTVFDGTNNPYQVSAAPKIRSMCTHYERLFAVGEDNLLWFSDDLDPTNWNVSLEQAGFIEFADNRGKLLKVISFLDYIYVFRKYGINRLTAYAEQTEFYVNEIYASGGIYPDTVSVCGDTVFFLSKDGLYAFDGLNTKKILANLDMLWASENENASAAYVGNEYVLCCKVNFDNGGLTDESDSAGNNAIVKLNVNDGTVKILRVDGIKGIEGVFSDITCCAAFTFFGENASKLGTFSESGAVLGASSKKVYITPETDMGETLEYKIVKYLSVCTEHDITIGLDFGEGWELTPVVGKSGYQKIFVKKRGRLLRLGVLCSGLTMKVKPIEITFVSY